MCFLPFVCKFCPAEPPEFISLPPLSKLAENSASLAETIINADASAPMRCVQAKNALIELRAKVIYSDIDVNVRKELEEKMQTLEHLIQTGADDLTDALASFSGVLDRLKLYVKLGLDDLSKLIDSETQHRNDFLQIGYSGMEQRAMVNTSFERYMALMNVEADGVLVKAQDAHMSLKRIEETLKTIQELNHKGKHISQSRLDELEHGSYWSWLFDEGKPGIIKHQRNIKTLDEFVDFTRETSNNIGDIIIKLKLFKSDATNLKETTVILDQFPVKSVNNHAQLLELALNRLTQSKDTFEGKLDQTKRQKQIV